MSIFDKLIDKIILKKYCLAMEADGEKIIVKGYKNNALYPVLGIINKGLSSLRGFFVILENGNAQVRLENFEKARDFFLTAKLGNCELKISQDLQRKFEDTFHWLLY